MMRQLYGKYCHPSYNPSIDDDADEVCQTPQIAERRYAESHLADVYKPSGKSRQVVNLIVLKAWANVVTNVGLYQAGFNDFHTYHFGLSVLSVGFSRI